MPPGLQAVCFQEEPQSHTVAQNPSWSRFQPGLFQGTRKILMSSIGLVVFLAFTECWCLHVLTNESLFQYVQLVGFP